MTKSALLAALLMLVTATALADQQPTFSGPESGSERRFVAVIRQDLMKRFPTARDAERAGYVRYTDADETGAISYANCQWNSSDARHPSQLWYDRNGNLLGADYSILMARSASRPDIWGIRPGRWSQLDGHQHWVTKTPSGALSYGHYVHDEQFAAAGGDPNHPSARTLVVLHKVQAANNVVRLFHFPALWDLTVWVKPNPNGAFADENPAVPH
jgi:hypothetical protein